MLHGTLHYMQEDGRFQCHGTLHSMQEDGRVQCEPEKKEAQLEPPPTTLQEDGQI